MSTQYEVSVHNIFEGDTPEEAIHAMIAWLQDHAATAGYRATAWGTNDETVFIDAERLNQGVDYGPR